MRKVVSVVGARPEFVQASVLSRVLRQHAAEVLVHTGQHYDTLMSDIFFSELDLPRPDYNLGVGAGSHARHVSEVIARLEPVIEAEKPDAVLVRGDTDSTVAAALTAAHVQVPLVHVESGCRSFDRTMPEELNRVVTDHLSDTLFAIAPAHVRNLQAEGITKNVHLSGDPMLDAALEYAPKADARAARLLGRFGVETGRFALVTVHRAGVTSSPQKLRALTEAMNRLDEPVVFPVHPRTQAAIAAEGLSFKPHVFASPPVGYLDMLALERNCRIILTDSGGVQREAYFWEKPCLTLRENTEHVDLVECGWNRLVGFDPDCILKEARTFAPPAHHPPLYGDGHASERIAATVLQEP